MKRLLTKIGLGAALIVPLAVQTQAAELQPLVVVTNDRNGDISYMSLIVSRNGIGGLHFQTRQANGEPPIIKNFSLEQIASSQGAVIAREDNYEAVKLHGLINSETGEGDLTISYLSNALLGKYKRCKLALRETKQNHYSLVNAYTGKIVKRLVIKTWSLGISTVQGVCPG